MLKFELVFELFAERIKFDKSFLYYRKYKSHIANDMLSGVTIKFIIIKYTRLLLQAKIEKKATIHEGE